MVANNPLADWRVDRAKIRTIGRDLQRPECILAERDGTLWAADARGGVMRIAPDGAQKLIVQKSLVAAGATNFAERYIQTQGSLPNGLAFDRDGNFLIANFGTDALELMTRGGESRTLYDNIDGAPLGKTNFVTRDSKDRLWLTVTTRTNPWSDSINTRVTDGYIALIDGRGIRIVADGLCGTNELRFDPTEDFLYVAETTARHVTRFRLQDDGTLTAREIYGPSDLGGFCDGIAFDASGNLWSTLIMAERLIAITPEGDVLTLLDDGDAAATRELDEAFAARKVTPEIMHKASGPLAPWMASVTFGGDDLRTVYLGSLRGTTIPYFRSPIAGQPLIYW
jgi:gluconolactonase